MNHRSVELPDAHPWSNSEWKCPLDYWALGTVTEAEHFEELWRSVSASLPFAVPPQGHLRVALSIDSSSIILLGWRIATGLRGRPRLLAGLSGGSASI